MLEDKDNAERMVDDHVFFKTSGAHDQWRMLCVDVMLIRGGERGVLVSQDDIRDISPSLSQSMKNAVFFSGARSSGKCVKFPQKQIFSYYLIWALIRLAEEDKAKPYHWEEIKLKAIHNA